MSRGEGHDLRSARTRNDPPKGPGGGCHQVIRKGTTARMKLYRTKSISLLALGAAILLPLRLTTMAQAASVLPAAADPVICTWKNDAKAAMSFTFDDGTVDHFAQAAPMLEKHGLRGSSAFCRLYEMLLAVWGHRTRCPSCC